MKDQILVQLQFFILHFKYIETSYKSESNEVH